MNITPGMEAEVYSCVERADTALEVGSGSLLVFATPCMAAIMEGAACDAIAPGLSDTETSVGTALNILHTSATPVGLEVRAKAQVTAVEGKKITFQLTAFDESGEIGRGVHERVVVNTEKFLAKVYEKL